MKDIFKRIEGREWDRKESKTYFPDAEEYYEGSSGIVTLADLLANKSWCQCVWGRGGVMCCDESNPCERWCSYSTETFQILQREGEQACIKYITKTML